MGIARNHHARMLLANVVILFLLLKTFAFTQQSSLSLEKRTQIEYAVHKFMATNDIPGISVGVVENGQHEWSGGFGMADLENSVPATAHTLYRLASISKPITATAAMLLWQRGKLDLDAPIQKYCPAFPLKGSPISTRQTLAHLGGIRHYKAESQDEHEVNNTRHFESPI